MNSQKTKYSFVCMILAAGFCGMLLTGCQVSIGGQTLPSPYYLYDDAEYYTKGPENKLAKEAAFLQEARGEERRNR